MSTFPLGRIVTTPAALDHLLHHGMTPAQLVERHSNGDWGDGLPPEDAEINTLAIETGGRLLSSYRIGAGKVWVITESDRSVTTCLLPTDY